MAAPARRRGLLEAQAEQLRPGVAPPRDLRAPAGGVALSPPSHAGFWCLALRPGRPSPGDQPPAAFQPSLSEGRTPARLKRCGGGRREFWLVWRNLRRGPEPPRPPPQESFAIANRNVFSWPQPSGPSHGPDRPGHDPGQGLRSAGDRRPAPPAPPSPWRPVRRGLLGCCAEGQIHRSGAPAAAAPKLLHGGVRYFGLAVQPFDLARCSGSAEPLAERGPGCRRAVPGASP